MTKFKVLGAALAVVAAAFAVSAVSAFAAPEWLVDNGMIANPVASDSEGTLTLKGLTSMVEAQCDGENTGFVGGKELDEVTKITELAKSTVNLVPCNIVKAGNIGCANPSSADALNLPWLTELELVEVTPGVTEVRDLIAAHAGGGNPGWRLECTIGGIFKVAHECTAPNATTAVANNATSKDVDITFDAHTENAKCAGNPGEEATVRGSVLILVPNKELAVNSD